MLIKSIFLRLSLIMSTAAAVCHILMAGTAFLMMDTTSAGSYALWSLGFALLALIFLPLVNRFDNELLKEAAVIIYPAGAILSIFLSLLLAMNLKEAMVIEDSRHLVVILGGVAMVVAMAIRCLDIPWLLTKEELDLRLRARQNRGQ